MEENERADDFSIKNNQSSFDLLFMLIDFSDHWIADDGDSEYKTPVNKNLFITENKLKRNYICI